MIQIDEEFIVLYWTCVLRPALHLEDSFNRYMFMWIKDLKVFIELKIVFIDSLIASRKLEYFPTNLCLSIFLNFLPLATVREITTNIQQLLFENFELKKY